MKKLFLALLLFAAASLAHGQSIYTPGGVNYGGGLVVIETQGTGAPSPTCNKFIRYWQTDASGSTSPMWQCNLSTSTMVNLSGAGGGASFAVTTTATGLQAMTGPLASTYFQVGNADTTIWRCGAKCLALGSTSATIDGTIEALNYIGNANGVLNPTILTGSNIGAQVNAAYALCSDATPCHVTIPAGVYSYSTPILLPRRNQGNELTIDRNATLTYTGTGDAIGTQPQVATGNHGETIIDGGGVLVGNSTATSGIHIRPGQGYAIRDVQVSGFTNGDAVWVDGANVVDIDNVTGSGSLNGLRITGNRCNSSNQCTWDRNSSRVWTNSGVSGATGYAPNNVHARGNKFSGNAHWGILEMDINPGTSPSFGNTFDDNDLEGNGTAGSNYGAVATCLSTGSTITHNYYEASPRQVLLGCSGDPGVTTPSGYTVQFGGTTTKPRIVDNYFTGGSNIEIEAHFAASPVISHNVETGSGSSCFVDGTFASGDIEIRGNQVTAASETCQGGGSGGYLAGYVEHYTSGGTKVFGGSVVVGGNATVNGGMNSATTQTSGIAAFQASHTCDNVAGTSIFVGNTKIFSGCAVLSGACTGSVIGISPAGIQSCKSGTWGPAN
jgi:hypothetical protein